MANYLISLNPATYADDAAAVAAIEAAGATVVKTLNFALTYEIQADAAQKESIAGVISSELATKPLIATLQLENRDHLVLSIKGNSYAFNDFNPAYTGAGEHVYLIDTGVKSSHEQFATATIHNLYSNFENDPYISSYDDINGHGTAMASLIIGNTQGGAPNATLHNVKLFNNGAGETTVGEIINALDAVLQHHLANNPSKVKSLCIAWVIPQNNFIDAKVAELDQNNIIVVCAAGNNGDDVNNYSPAGLNQVITAGSIDRSYSVSPFNNTPYDGGNSVTSYVNYGAALDIFAISVAITVASVDTDQAYMYGSGTSAAAAIVAGFATHYISKHPTKTSSQLKDVILAEGHIRGMNNIIFDEVSGIDYTQVNRSLIQVDPVGAMITEAASGRLLNVQYGSTATANVGLDPATTDVEVLNFAPCPPWISFDSVTGVVSVDTTLASASIAPGVYLFAIKGSIDGKVQVEEFSIGVYQTAESELDAATSYYYDADAADYDAVVSYQVSIKA